MVYIPWADYGICRYWMLKSCYSDKQCKWKHPDPEERSRLWNMHTEQQERDAANGIPMPVAPYKSEKTREKEREKEESWKTTAPGDASTSPPRYGPFRAPPPPPMAPPPIAALGNNFLPPTSFGNNLPPPDTGMWRRPVFSEPTTGMTDSSNGVMAPPPTSSWRSDFPPPTGVGNNPPPPDTGMRRQPVISAPTTGMTPLPTGAMAPPPIPQRRMEIDAGRGDVKDEVEKVKPRPDRVRVPQTSLNFNTALPQPTSQSLLSVLMSNMGATKRLSNGEPKHVGPHPSTIRVSAPYMSQAEIDQKLKRNIPQDQMGAQERSMAEAREDTFRLQGVMWIDQVRRSLSLPIRTFTTACVYYHKFRLAHGGTTIAGVDYGNAWADACAASLLTACKVEDTLKKSRDILAAAYNLKVPVQDQLSADDPVFEAQSRSVIGLERLVLEAGGFDFRSKHPHDLMDKMANGLRGFEDIPDELVRQLHKVAWTVTTDTYRTFAPLKMTTHAMAHASLELAMHLVATKEENDVSAIHEKLKQRQANRAEGGSSREEVMEIILDLLDLYVQHTAQTALGPLYSLDDFLRIRLIYNKECNESQIPRNTVGRQQRDTDANTLRVSNGHPTPVSPMEPGPQPSAQNQIANGSHPQPEGGGTLRFILNPQLAAEEKAEVQKYFVEEWEEYEEEIEVPQPRARSNERERERERERPREPPRNERGGRDGARPRDDRERDGDRDRDRDGRFRDRRYDDRRFDDRRRFDRDRFDDDRRRR